MGEVGGFTHRCGVHAAVRGRLDLNTAFLADVARLVVGLSAPDHFNAPTFHPKIPGSWLGDLSHVELYPRLSSPFTPTGERDRRRDRAGRPGRVHPGAAQASEGPDRLLETTALRLPSSVTPLRVM